MLSSSIKKEKELPQGAVVASAGTSFEQASETLKTDCSFGQISFINTLPLVLPLMEKQEELGFPMVFGTPQELNQKFKEGFLNLGAMSSYYFLEDGSFDLFPDISISGTGQVGSVLLFAREELSGLEGNLVYVPESSATSVKLLQLLLKEEYGISPKFASLSEAELASSLSDFLASTGRFKNAHALLVIGDRALRHDLSASGFLRVDLAQWWFNRFGLPFVFGVWAARKDWRRYNEAKFSELSILLVEALSQGLKEKFAEVLKEACRRTGLSEERLSCYYRSELDYRFKEEHAQALALFGELCRKHGFLARA